MDVKLTVDQKRLFDERYLELLAAVSGALTRVNAVNEALGGIIQGLKNLRRDVVGTTGEPQN